MEVHLLRNISRRKALTANSQQTDVSLIFSDELTAG
jgi:hypothetical protein